MEVAEGLAAKLKMKTKYKHIYFEAKKVGSSTIWICRNNKTQMHIGFVSHFNQWRRWVFEGIQGCVFDTSCLANIIDFMNQL